MKTQNWKVVLYLTLDEGSHPRNWIPDTIYDVLDSNEDLTNYEFEKLDDKT